MGNKDYGRRESKKLKKDAKKAVKIDLEPQINVEVIKKGKKPKESDF